MPVIPVKRLVDPKKNIWKKWRAKEKERHKGSLTPKSCVSSQRWQIVFDTTTCQKLGKIPN
jgi:hypothetical protein